MKSLVESINEGLLSGDNSIKKDIGEHINIEWCKSHIVGFENTKDSIKTIKDSDGFEVIEINDHEWSKGFEGRIKFEGNDYVIHGCKFGSEKIDPPIKSRISEIEFNNNPTIKNIELLPDLCAFKFYSITLIFTNCTGEYITSTFNKIIPILYKKSKPNTVDVEIYNKDTSGDLNLTKLKLNYDDLYITKIHNDSSIWMDMNSASNLELNDVSCEELNLSVPKSQQFQINDSNIGKLNIVNTELSGKNYIHIYESTIGNLNEIIDKYGKLIKADSKTKKNSNIR